MCMNVRVHALTLSLYLTQQLVCARWNMHLPQEVKTINAWSFQWWLCSADLWWTVRISFAVLPGELGWVQEPQAARQESRSRPLAPPGHRWPFGTDASYPPARFLRVPRRACQSSLPSCWSATPLYSPSFLLPTSHSSFISRLERCTVFRAEADDKKKHGTLSRSLLSVPPLSCPLLLLTHWTSSRSNVHFFLQLKCRIGCWRWMAGKFIAVLAHHTLGRPVPDSVTKLPL